jgi:hypothetical protein
MKISHVCLALSLTANAALVALAAFGLSAGSTDQPAETSTGAMPKATSASAPAGAGAEWSALESLDLPAQRDRLRAEGFPPAIVRAILAAQIREGFAARRKALDAGSADLVYWKNPVPDAKTQAAWRALDKEEQQALKELLGRDAENSQAAALHRQFPDYSDQQINQLTAIRERYDEQRQEISNAARSGGGGFTTYTPDERERLAALEKNMHAEFASVLTPQQLDDYDLRVSNTANNLRYNLGTLELDEGEFRTLYRLQAAFDEQFRDYAPGMSQEQMRARSDAQKKLNTDIAAALGADRYAEYQRATDYNYRQTSQLTTRLGLPPETANQLYAIQKEFETRRSTPAEPGNTGPVTQADLSQRRAALQAEALAKVTPLLRTPAALEAYKQYGGQWLQNLAPRLMPAAGATPLSGGSPAPAPKP